MENERVYSQEDIENTPSRKDGVSEMEELRHRQLAAASIQKIGEKLRVTQLAINTAVMFFHWFFMDNSIKDFDRTKVSTACFFLACKVEEQPRMLEHVIKAQFDNRVQFTTAEYEERAAEMTELEETILISIDFHLSVCHPHMHVIEVCRLVKAPKDLARCSYFLATSSIHLTTLTLVYTPRVVAAVCIHLACKWSNWELPPSKEQKEWWQYVDKTITQNLLETLSQQFLNILEECDPNRLQTLMSRLQTMLSRAKQRGDSAVGSRGFPNPAAAQSRAPNPTATQSRAPNPAAAQNRAPNPAAAQNRAPNPAATQSRVPNPTAAPGSGEPHREARRSYKSSSSSRPSPYARPGPSQQKGPPPAPPQHKGPPPAPPQHKGLPPAPPQHKGLPPAPPQHKGPPPAPPQHKGPPPAPPQHKGPPPAASQHKGPPPAPPQHKGPPPATPQHIGPLWPAMTYREHKEMQERHRQSLGSSGDSGRPPLPTGSASHRTASARDSIGTPGGHSAASYSLESLGSNAGRPLTSSASRDPGLNSSRVASSTGHPDRGDMRHPQRTNDMSANHQQQRYGNSAGATKRSHDFYPGSPAPSKRPRSEDR